MHILYKLKTRDTCTYCTNLRHETHAHTVQIQDTRHMHTLTWQGASSFRITIMSSCCVNSGAPSWRVRMRATVWLLAVSVATKPNARFRDHRPLVVCSESLWWFGMCVCMCVCMYACAQFRDHRPLVVCRESLWWFGMYVCMCVYVYVCIYICMNVCMHERWSRVPNLGTTVHKRFVIPWWLGICVCMHVFYTREHMYACILHTWAYVCVYAYTHTNTNTLDTYICRAWSDL